ncbi:MAG: VIT domain-containing protein [bacterium]
MDGVMQIVDRAFTQRRGRYAHPVGLLTTQARKDKTLSPYFYLPEGKRSGLETLPLKSTSATVNIAGVIARVRVTQVYKNTGQTAIEAIYVFPGSTRAAVHGMRMKIGKRVVEAKIQERAKARRIYERARRQGRRASLLAQQRANVFTMSVANIMPGDTIVVELDYSELLEPEDGTYSFVYPTVVGPRYGGGANPKTSQWIANPYLKAGSKVPYKFGLKLHLATPIGIKQVTSPSHKIQVMYENKHAANIGLVGAQGGNRDFVLRYRLAGGKIETGVMTYNQGGERFFLMMMEPPTRVSTAQIPRREYIFVLDVSGSMYGYPLNTAKGLIRTLLRSLRSTDYFNVVLFAGTSVVMSKASLPANEANLQRAIRVIDRQRGGGGTELLAALRNAYSVEPPAKTGVSRSVVVITDGYVGVEAETFRFIRKNLGRSNCFAFGIGSSVNRALIEGMARAGMGAPFVVLGPSGAATQATRFRKYIESPLLTDIKLEFSSAGVYDVVPQRPPDLLAKRPLIVFGKYRGQAGKILVSGYTGAGPFKRALSLTPGKVGAATQPLRVLWARKWVDQLMDQLAMLPRNRDITQAVTNLGLTYNLLTRFTSFVAVDRVVANRTGRAVGVKQPLPLPKGVSNRAVGGNSPTPGPVMGGATGATATPRRPPAVYSASERTESVDEEKNLRSMPGSAPPAPCARKVGGCRCQTNTTGSLPLLLLPLAVWLLWLRRRRRSNEE